MLTRHFVGKGGGLERCVNAFAALGLVGGRAQKRDQAQPPAIGPGDDPGRPVRPGKHALQRSVGGAQSGVLAQAVLPDLPDGCLRQRINLVNLRENIRPTRPRADLILKKGPDHLVEKVALRKL